MDRLKKYAKWAAKGIATAIAFSINPAFGICIGAWLFCGFETFSSENR